MFCFAVFVKESACDLYTWGGGGRGRLGHKDDDKELLPRVVESLLGRNITMVACGGAHTVTLSSKKIHTHSPPLLLFLLIYHTFSSLFFEHFSVYLSIPLILISSFSSGKGEVFSWGAGTHGRLGHGNLRDRYSPLMVDAPLRGLDIVQIACYEYHSAALSGK